MISQNMTIRAIAYLQMMRPANIVTAWADILAGYAAAGLISSPADWTVSSSAQFSLIQPLLWLLLSTTGLYGGGVVFNDVFDAELDALERPERPIPSGRSSVLEGVVLGITLLIVGIIAAAQVSPVSAVIATAIALAALLYDSVSKHHAWIGTLNMGLCRGGNLLLGMSAMPLILQERWLLAIVPILYVAAITLISRGEVNGGNTIAGSISLGLLALVIGGLIGLDVLSISMSQKYFLGFLSTLPFTLFWCILVIPSFVQAARNPSAELIRLAVRSGVIALIALDGAIAASFSNWVYGVAVLSLLPFSRFLAKQFAVT
jgi:4-hydroxybenzoate polyprenyltransferase